MSMIKRNDTMHRLPLLFCFLFAAIALLCAPTKAGPSPAYEIGVRETDIYSAGTTRIRNLKLTEGCAVKIVRAGSLWTKVMLRNGVAGNVYTSNLRTSERTWRPLPPSKNLKPTAKAPSYARIVADLAVVRSVPNSEIHPFRDRSRIEYAPRGVVLPVIGRKGHWLQVRLGKARTAWLIDETVELVSKSEYGPAQLLNIEKSESVLGTAYSFTFTRRVFHQAAEDIKLSALSLTFFNTADEKGVLCYRIPLAPSYRGLERSIDGNTLRVQIKNFHIDESEPLNNLVIVLDPGHGSGYDNPDKPDWGAIHSGYYEADLNLAMSTKLYYAFERKGADVYLTRTVRQVNDTFLYDRIDKARNIGADIFLSIHHNSASSTSMRGMEFYWSTSGGRALAKEIMASCVQKSLPMNDKGIYYGSFAVTRVMDYPAALVEMGFMSCPWELGKLLTSEYQDLLVKAIVEGVEEFARKKGTKEIAE
jgi:N-acetylmuramoyl-L-alanine amidase